MRRFYFIIFIFWLKWGMAGDDRGGRMLMQEIRYSAEGVHEVSLVWGINYWQKVPQEYWPAGSYIKDNLLYTPLKKKGSYFSTSIRVPKNTMLDYVFWISKGFRNAPADLWDVNVLPDKDYHTLVLSNSAIMIESKLKAVPRVMLTILEFAVPLFILLLVSLCVYLFYRKRSNAVWPAISATNLILSSSLTLFLFLLFIRPSITGTAWDLYLDPMYNLGSLFKPALHDFVFVFVCTLIFWLPAIGLSRSPRLQKWIAFSYAICCGAFLVYGLLNIKIVEALGKPFTYQWLYYSDFLKSPDAKVALASNIDLHYLLRIALILLSALIFCYLLVHINNRLWNTRSRRTGALIAIHVVSGVYFLYAVNSSYQNTWDINKVENPVIAFLESTNPLSAAPELFTMEIADSLQYHAREKSASLAQSGAKIKNVILFVLESTPAEYISAYQSKYEVTPELSKYLPNALVFKNVYAHAPATNNSMVSLLGSIYPMISHATITQKCPGLAMPTLSSELKKQNYRTAFFNSADNRFQKTAEFLACRKFDVIKDCRCRAQFTCPGTEFLNGSNDENTAEDMMSWIEQDHDSPFFAMLWTYQTHYPYFNSGQEINYKTNDPDFNRYLNAVHHSDKVFGQLMEYLKAKGLYESTLVVLVGDHGEAFGRHGQLTHASHIYEENLHVPCVFLNPAFKNKEYEGLGGLIDIAPTIMNLLKQPAPAVWQGKDLFAANDKDRVYFFSPWSDYLFGYREGRHKYIFNATRNLTEVYDLETDPQETHNLADNLKNSIEVSHQRLAGWVQSVNHFMEEKLKTQP